MTFFVFLSYSIKAMTKLSFLNAYILCMFRPLIKHNTYM